MNNAININALDLENFFKYSSLPVFNTPPKTFLEISRQPHYENVISNIYAFFFDVNEEHGLGDLFINSLIEYIKETLLGESKDFTDFKDFNIDLEYSTEGNGRIDILISSYDSAIIIENKIYHVLNNNLNDYWDTALNANNLEKKSIGIVLSLSENCVVNHPHFIQLTHINLLNRVMDNIGSYLLSASDKYLMFLKDFCQNIKNLSQKTMKKEDLTFILDNVQKINEVVEIDKRYKNYIKTEVERACNQLEGFKLISMRSGSFNEVRLRYYESEKVKDLFFTILFDGLFSATPTLRIYIELRGNKIREIQQKLPLTDSENFPSEVEIANDFITNKNNWAHFSRMEPLVVSKEDVFNLSNFIVEKLQETKFLEAISCLEHKLLEAHNKLGN